MRSSSRACILVMCGVYPPHIKAPVPLPCPLLCVIPCTSSFRTASVALFFFFSDGSRLCLFLFLCGTPMHRHPPCSILDCMVLVRMRVFLYVSLFLCRFAMNTYPLKGARELSLSLSRCIQVRTVRITNSNPPPPLPPSPREQTRGGPQGNGVHPL